MYLRPWRERWLQEKRNSRISRRSRIGIRKIGGEIVIVDRAGVQAGDKNLSSVTGMKEAVQVGDTKATKPMVQEMVGESFLEKKGLLPLLQQLQAMGAHSLKEDCRMEMTIVGIASSLDTGLENALY